MITIINNGFAISHNEYIFISHTNDSPAFFIGNKDIDIKMDKGEFKIDDQTTYSPASLIEIKDNKIVFKEFTINIVMVNNNLSIQFMHLNQPLKVRLNADKTESIYGLGEHFTSLNLRKHVVKNWVEEHITRKQIYNKIIRRIFKLRPKKWKFEEYKTYFVIPSFISSNSYFCHIDTLGYGTFNFKNDNFHEISFTSIVNQIVLSKNMDLLQTGAALCKFQGIMPKLPDWIHDGMILGIQGGTKKVDELTSDLIAKGAKINGIWSQDWCGELFTYFGKQVYWNWEVDNTLYPNLREQIKIWKKSNINFLGYINPYINHNGDMFQFAEENNYLVKNKDNSTFLTQATSFKFGIVDLTNSKAYIWFKNIIKTNYIEFGLMGWMADFGEYLPTDCILNKGVGENLHNSWPDLWIKLNREVLDETNMLSDAIFFNRAGYKDNSKSTTLVWQGDQHVDFTNDFGIKSIVRSALSLSLSGIGVVHSDVGGYTTVPGIKRSEELFLRWLEMNTFTPVLRTHEGNKPWVNIQAYSNDITKNATVIFSNIHHLLKKYLLHVEDEYQQLGYPMIRPTFFYYTFISDDTYFLGEDLYVCPVLNKKQLKKTVYIPTDNWAHLFTGVIYNEGTHTISSPIGTPPVFYKINSQYKKIFEEITVYIKTK